MKHSQRPQVLPHQHLLSQPQSFASSLQTAQPSSSRQMLPLQPPMIPATRLSHHDRPSVSQPQDITSGGHSSSRPHAFAGTQNGNLGQETRTNADGFPCQCQNTNNRGHMHGERINGTKWKRRGRSPQRRGVEGLDLAVSSRPL